VSPVVGVDKCELEINVEPGKDVKGKAHAELQGAS
jgi:hypothetical protein